jgi:single-strand DNA-binding protein
MFSLNQFALGGQISCEPNIQFTERGDPVANLKIVVTQKFYDKHTKEWIKRAETHPVSVFGTHFVECIKEKVKKNDLVFVQGVIQTRFLENEEGINRFFSKLIVPAFAGKFEIFKKYDNVFVKRNSAAMTEFNY